MDLAWLSAARLVVALLRVALLALALLAVPLLAVALMVGSNYVLRLAHLSWLAALWASRSERSK